MVKEIKTTMLTPGIYLSGMIISQTPKLFQKRDGSGAFVLLTVEISLKPGVVEFTQYFDATDPAIKIEKEEVIHYPRLPELTPIIIKVEQYRADKGKFVITRGSLLDGEKAA